MNQDYGKSSGGRGGVKGGSPYGGKGSKGGGDGASSGSDGYGKGNSPYVGSSGSDRYGKGTGILQTTLKLRDMRIAELEAQVLKLKEKIVGDRVVMLETVSALNSLTEPLIENAYPAFSP